MIRKYKHHTPVIHPSAFIAENATVIGRVVLGEDTSVWYGAVLRGDEASITIGKGSNVQDNATLHGNDPCNVVLGEYVTVGHNAIVHGCTVGDDTLVGMGATILNGAVIGSHCIIGAGALVKENEVIPDYSLVVGVPAKIVRTLTPEQTAKIRKNADDYIGLAKDFLADENG